MTLTPKIKWNKNPTQVNSTMLRFTDRALYAVGEAVQQASQDSAKWIVDAKIKSGSRTGTLWHDLVNSDRGNSPGARVDSGEMMRSVGSTPAMERARGFYESEFGLRLPSAGGRKYFIEQDEGFELELFNGDTKWVPGMHTFEAVLPGLRRNFRLDMATKGFKQGKLVGGGRTAARESNNYGTGADESQMLINRSIALRRYQQMATDSAAQEVKKANFQGAMIEQFGSMTAYLNRNREV